MRGTPQNVSRGDLVQGIIPAHAGNTTCFPSQSPTRRDHPRACGEHFLTYHVFSSTWGSSPRMRGTRHHSRGCAADCGIIPAHAGNTVCQVFLFSACRDHPRACGEHSIWQGKTDANQGSSPRMRGTLLSVDSILSRLGIIPAHAGNTLLTGCRWVRSRDHPRACGEHAMTRTPSTNLSGSSPRMRGTPSVF